MKAGEPFLTGLEDRSGAIWLGGGFGLGQWRDGRFTNLNGSLGWSNVMVRALAEDRAGNLYVGSFGRGLSRHRQGQWTHYTQEDGLADNHIAALCVDGDDTLWIGTVNGGLSRFRQERFASITLRDGLPSNSIGALIEDDQGHLWLGSNRGLIRLSRQELNAYLDGQRDILTCHVFNRSDGLNSIECGGGAQPACWKTSDGKLWFATVKGVAVVDPSHLPFNPLPPPVMIEEVALDGEPVLNSQWSTDGMAQASVAGTDQPQTAEYGHVPAVKSPILNRQSKILAIPPGKVRLEIRFTGLSLLVPEKVRFRYRLEGLDESWSDAGSRRTASYSHVPPGEYRFKVTACNNDGVWNEIGAVLPLIVLPHFWQANWFRFLILLAIVGGTGWLVQRAAVGRMHRQLESLERQRLLATERGRIAQDIHDDLGARLTQIGLLSELAKRSSSKPAEAQAYLEQITLRSRETTQAMDEVVWAVDPTKDSLEDLMNYLVSMSEQLFQETSINCRLDIPLDLPSQPISAKARHGILLVVKEALNNCLKHSGGSEVWIRASLQESVLQIEIEDNGNGFKNGGSEAKRAGNGLRNMRQRLEDLGGGFKVFGQPGRGTKIQLKLDLSRYA
jgi:signal transduction histidine kinase